MRLEALRVLPGVAIQQDAEKGALYRHGVEVVLRGTYFELVQYLEELEKLPARLLWGRVELLADPYPEVKLTVAVYTVTPQRSLLAPASAGKAD